MVTRGRQLGQTHDTASFNEPGRYALNKGLWEPIDSFGSRKDLDSAQVAKAVVTENGHVVIFDKVQRDVKQGPTGNESVLYDNVADPVSPQVYSALAAYSNRTPMILTEQFDSMRNAEELLKYIADPKSYGIASGRKPSGPCHFGHKLVIETISFFQKNGVQAFIPIADTEASLDPKITQESKYKYFIADNLLDWGASGLNLDAAHVYLQSEEMRVMNISYLAARGLEMPTIVDILGRETFVDEMKFLFASITQVGDILLPQHPDFGKQHSFMLSGADQDGNMAMALTLSKKIIASYTSGDSDYTRLVNTVPSSLYIRSISNMEGRKESASEPDTTIYLGPSRNVYLQTPTGKILGRVDQLSLDDRVADMQEKVDRFSAIDPEKVAEAMTRRQSLFSEFTGAERMDADTFKALTQEVIEDHHVKRREIFEYAMLSAIRHVRETTGDHAEIEKLAAAGKTVVPGFDENRSANAPDFWEVPSDAYVPGDKKKVKTSWFSMIAEVADRLTL